jgi:hypothetical protein
MTGRFQFLSRVAALSVALTVFASSMAAAQTPLSNPPSGATTQRIVPGSPAFSRLVEGKEVRITTAAGTQHRGRVAELSGTSLTLADRSRTSVAFDQIVKVEKTAHRARNGALIGLLAGAAVGAWPAKEGNCGDGCGWWPIILGMYAGIGAGVGALIGEGISSARAFDGGDVIYDVHRPIVQVAPIVSPRRAGVALAVRW